MHQLYAPKPIKPHGTQLAPNLWTWPGEDALGPTIESCRDHWRKGASMVVKPQKAAIKAVFFDMDSTVIEQESIVELARVSGKAKEVEQVTELAMAGELDFDEALRARVLHLCGLPESVFETTLRSLTLQPGMEEFARRASQMNCRMYLISGGFEPLAKPIAERLGFAGSWANRLESKEGVLTGRVLDPIVNGEAKKQYVERVMQEHHWQAHEIMVVGDGANDRLMMGLSELPVGFRPKDNLWPVLAGAIYPPEGHDWLAQILWPK